MSDSQDIIRGYEMDTDAFTTWLRDLADAIDAEEVGVTHLNHETDVPMDNFIEASIAFDYTVGPGHDDLLRPLEIEDRDDDWPY